MSGRKWNITGKNERGQASNLTERRQEYDSDKSGELHEKRTELGSLKIDQIVKLLKMPLESLKLECLDPHFLDPRIGK
jgi:hypothetical protein